MTMPGFSAEAAFPGRRGSYRAYISLARRASTNSVALAALNCCPPGFEVGGCADLTDCSQLKCTPPLICCDCTEVHCTTEAQCRVECSK